MSSTINSASTLASLQNDGWKIIVIGSSMLSVAITSVGLRFTAKYLNENAFGLDDLLIGLSLLFYLATEALVLRAVTAGRQAVGVHDWGYVEFAELTTFYSLLYWSVVAFATLSILVLYRRIFYMHRFFSIASQILIALTLVWWFSGTIVEAFGFRPMQAYWDTSVHGHYYIDYNAFWATNMISELILETVILVLPLREIARLQLENRKKALVVVMFGMGVFVLATGIVRINYVWTQSDMTPGVIWLSVHSSTAITSACLPTYGPLLSRIPGLRDNLYHRRDQSSRSGNINNTIGGISSRGCTNPNATYPPHASPKLRQNSSVDSLYNGVYFDWKPSATMRETSTDNEDEDRDIICKIGGEDSCNGLTKKISTPSPVSADINWGPAAAFGEGGEPQTRRADLEYGLTSQLGEEKEIQPA